LDFAASVIPIEISFFNCKTEGYSPLFYFSYSFLPFIMFKKQCQLQLNGIYARFVCTTFIHGDLLWNEPMALLKKVRAAGSLRFSDSKKSMVFSSLSTARYRYTH
jgi:hypothetical protein